MSRMFCTLKEAAETLHASEDQIQTLLEKGILHEFREGPHRFLKEADVGALASVGEGRATAPSSGSLSPEAQRPSSSPRVNAKANHSAAARVPPPGSGRTGAGRSKTADRRQRMPDRRPGTALPSVVRRPPSVHRDAPSLSVRQWFWIGLIQDRPMVIALLSSLVLLGLSVLAAGLCFVAETI